MKETLCEMTGYSVMGKFQTFTIHRGSCTECKKTVDLRSEDYKHYTIDLRKL